MLILVHVWPAAAEPDKRRQVPDLLAKGGELLDRREVWLNRRGMRNYMLQIYGHQQWSGNFRNHFRGVWAKVDGCYAPYLPLELFTVRVESLGQALALKTQLRELFALGKHSVHMTDSEAETAYCQAILRTQRRVDFLNQADPDRYRCFTRRIERLERDLKRAGVDRREVVVCSRAVFALMGERRVRQLSWIASRSLPPWLNRRNDHEFEPLPPQRRRALLDSAELLIFHGIRFVPPDLLPDAAAQEDVQA